MAYEKNFFGDTRRTALQLWAQGTKRNCQFMNDDLVDSYECVWQDRATDLPNYEHISIFCSLGKWASNISDILKNDAHDDYNYLDDDQCQALYRYYTRLLLVISEILGDFEDIVKQVEGLDTKQARRMVSEGGDEIDFLFQFINQVCKHKEGRIHGCNHHLPIHFEDCTIAHLFNNPISISNLDFRNPDGILMPKLEYVIQVVLNCYPRLNQIFEDEEKFRVICDEYNGVSLLA